MYLEKRHEVTVSVHQLVILQLFNDSTSYTREELLEASKIPATDLDKILSGLVDSKIVTFTTTTYNLNFELTRYV
jgi:DNA-binding IscR family transcriptional regulator